jgi:hypothetical protein
MGCCGQKRAALARLPTRSSRREPAKESSQKPTDGPQAADGRSSSFSWQDYSVAVRYTEASTVLVRGAITGRLYRFSSASPVQVLDARDATVILRAGIFRLD